MPNRKPITDLTLAEVLVACGRRCCLCYGLEGDASQKEGQVAHVDRDASNPDADNLAWLCLPHHASYDSRNHMTKAVTPGELRVYRDRLHAAIESGVIYQSKHPAGPAIASTASGNAHVTNAVGGTVNIRSPRGKKAPTINPPPGTIGHDPVRRSYCEYLIKRYNEFAAKRRAPGTTGRPFHYAVIRKNIEKAFGSRVALIRVERFEELVTYLQSRIDQTIFGKGGSSRNYRTFEEHAAKTRGG